MKKIIVHVQDRFDGTMGYQINELLLQNKKNNDEVHLITTKNMDYFKKEYNYEDDILFEKEANIIIHRIDYRFKAGNRFWIKNLFKYIDQLNPDLVFIHGIADFKDLVLYQRRKKYVIVRDSHMSWVASKKRFNKLFYWFYKVFFSKKINKGNKYKIVYALGVEEKEYLLKLGIKEDKIEMLPHGYSKETMFFSKIERDYFRNKYNIKDDVKVISYIGRFDYNKRPDIILDILERSKIEKEKIVLFFMGYKDNKYIKYFNDKLKKFNDFKIIVKNGTPFNELYKYYSFSDICVFPKETTLSSIHAQVCGCEVIMEKHVSNMERVVNHQNLFKLDDLDEASTILKTLVEKPNDLRKDKYVEKLSNREYSNQMKKIYKLMEE